jgi:hypothetical protein
MHESVSNLSVVREGFERTRATANRLSMTLGTMVLLALLAVGAVGASSAGAATCGGCAPWWHVVQDVRPSNIAPGSGKDEVQELKVAASGGEVLVEGQKKNAAFPWDASAAVVQSKLEGLFGAANVTVTGGPTVTGTGTLTAASTVLTAVTGAFAEGQEISGAGIPTGTKIQTVGAGTLTLSAPATEAGVGVALAVLVPYRVTFQGALSEDGELPLTNPGLSTLACEAPYELGECLKGEASVTVATAPVSDGLLTVQAVNVGDGPTAGAVTLSDVLPAGFSVVESQGVPQVGFFTMQVNANLLDLGPEAGFGGFLESLDGLRICSTTSASVSCTLHPDQFEFIEERLFQKTGEGMAELKSFETFEIRVQVRADPKALSGPNHLEVSGGGAPAARVSHLVSVSAAPPVFGAEDFSMVPEQDGGEADVQAGSHPFQFTTGLSLNQNLDSHKPPALPRNLSFNLPAGMIGNATAVRQCTDQQFAAILEEGTGNRCPEDSALGAVTLTFDEPIQLHLATVTVPLFNLTPQVGEPARFGFEFAHTDVILDTSVRAGSDYGVVVTVANITQLTNFLSSTVTIWGVPGDPRHDGARGWGCIRGGKLEPELTPHLFPCEQSSEQHPPPFLTMPTACTLPFSASVEGVSWPVQGHPSGIPLDAAEHGTYTLQDEFQRTLGVTGCNTLPFAPTIRVAPDVQSASTSTGLKVDVLVPQEVSNNSAGLASSAVKDITVALPEGVTVNPAGGNGLSSCGTGQVGFTKAVKLNPESEPENETDLFTPTLPEPLSPGMNLEALGFCPNASKIGTARIVSPLIKDPVVGSVYLASQNQNPFGSLLAAYIVAEDPVSGTIVKLPGRISLCEAAGEVLDGLTCAAPGQLITQFKNNPQLAFEDAELHFFGGERAPLATPPHCGPYTTSASFTPWSQTPAVPSTSTFNITSGPGGGPCPGPTLPFSPTLTAGTTNINAGAFSPLTTTISRADGNQDMQSVQLHMPAGLSGILAGVPLCPEAQANEGACSPESQIGETTVSAGVGNDPVSVKGGRVYITQGYRGAPFGLSIVNPVKAGPFDLEHDTANPNNNPPCDCVVVRAKIEVDPTTANLTITTDPTGAHAIPHLIDGIPVQIQKVNVLINRPGFTFNPTNCSAMSITGSIGSTEGATSPVSVPFQATNCATLAFAPKFVVSTSGKTSKANGASLAVKLTYPSAPFGSQANIKQVKVELPKVLPSRLTTLQKACTAAQFNSNPAGCPAASIIGHAKAVTPLLPVPLEGPAYFVSHGGEAFPSLIVVLQGAAPYNVTLDLVGTTFISKAGITSSTFKTVPDAPVGSFELMLPQGKFSALAANGNLCTSKLAMPTEFLAQNGAKINESTPVSVTGCAKKKALTRAQKLAAALKACNKKAKGKRAACRASARKKYGPIARKKSKGKRRA